MSGRPLVENPAVSTSVRLAILRPLIKKLVAAQPQAEERLSRFVMRFAGDDQDIWDAIAYRGPMGKSAGQFLDSFKSKEDMLHALRYRRGP